MKGIALKIYDFILAPFRKDFKFLIIISLLVCCPWLYYRLFINYNIKDVMWECTHGYLLCYFVVLIGNILPKRIYKYYKIVFLILAFGDFCIESSCLLTTRSPFSSEHIQIIMGTNLDEASEFLKTYCSLPLLCTMLGAMVIIFFIGIVKDQINYIGVRLSLLLCIFTICSFFFFTFIKKTNSFDCKFYYKLFAFLSYEPSPDLRMYRSALNVKCHSQLPQNIVLIIGESFSKYHSSLYGYEKHTNPKLDMMVKDSVVLVYEDVVSPATHTIPCIKSIMSTYKVEYGESIDWYRCETLINIMKAVGYKTIWMSNQSPTGLHDNVASSYANLCDEVLYVGSKYKGVYKNDYDGEILNMIKTHKDLFDGQSFVVIHLMGSHISYKDRYPSEWQVFNEYDYNDLPIHQRDVLSSYDNSILYNDYVVSEIFNFLNDKECVSIYFSDHGLDLFESSEDYYGYAMNHNQKSVNVASAIPFLVYMSTAFKEEFPELKSKIIECTDRDLNTGYTIDFISELLDLQFY